MIFGESFSFLCHFSSVPNPRKIGSIIKSIGSLSVVKVVNKCSPVRLNLIMLHFISFTIQRIILECAFSCPLIMGNKPCLPIKFTIFEISFKQIFRFLVHWKPLTMRQLFIFRVDLPVIKHVWLFKIYHWSIWIDGLTEFISEGLYSLMICLDHELLF